jgi:beta-lactamase class A
MRNSRIKSMALRASWLGLCLAAVAVDAGCASREEASPESNAALDVGGFCASPGAFTFHCSDDGNMYSCPAGMLVGRDCGGRGCVSNPVGVADTCQPAGGPLQDTINALGQQIGARSPGTTAGISVRDLATGEVADYRGEEAYISASAVKAIWVANALADTSVEQVEPLVYPVFAYSDNNVAGQVLDLLPSYDRVNTFMWGSIGMGESSFCAWNIDRDRTAGNCQNLFDYNNYFTANDGVAFLTKVWDRSLLGDWKTAKLLEWMTFAPRSGYGGWLGTRLPPQAQATMHHKSGSLPPPYTSRVSHDFGIIEVPGGHPYAVAILMGEGYDYDGAQLPTLEYASCVVYHAIAKDADPFGAGC